MKQTEYEVVQSDVFSPNDLCRVTIFASYSCLHFNNENYVESSVKKSGLSQMIWNFISLPECEQHPLTILIKGQLAGRKFDLPHVTTWASNNYQKIPGIRVNEFNKTHKHVNVSFELSLWATIGQLKPLSEDTIKRMSIEVHSAIGKMQL